MDYQDQDYGPNVNINISNHEQRIVELFTAPVTRYFIQKPQNQWRETVEDEPVVASEKYFLAAYWCPQLALIRLAVTSYGRPARWGTVITEGVPKFENNYEAKYEAIMLAMSAINAAENDPDSFIPGSDCEERAWEKWNAKSDEEKAGATERFDDVPF